MTTTNIIDRDDHGIEEVMTEADVTAAVAALLDVAGVTLDSLRSQAHAGQFETEQQRRAWFVIRGLGRG